MKSKEKNLIFYKVIQKIDTGNVGIIMQNKKDLVCKNCRL